MSLYRHHELLIAGYLSQILLVSRSAASCLFALFHSEDNPQSAYHAALAVASQLDYLHEFRALPPAELYLTLLPDASEAVKDAVEQALAYCLEGVINGRAAAILAHNN